MLCGGIDLGGTKIEARLFEGPEARTVETRRIPTPQGNFEDMMTALEAQVGWLESRASGLPVGVAVPQEIAPGMPVADLVCLNEGLRLAECGLSA